MEKAQGDTGPPTWIVKKKARKPSPVPFESAHLEDLKQLERVSDYITEHFPERKGQGVDVAFVEILGDLKRKLARAEGELRAYLDEPELEALKVPRSAQDVMTMDWERETEKSAIEVALDKRLSHFEARTAVVETMITDLKNQLTDSDWKKVRTTTRVETSDPDTFTKPDHYSAPHEMTEARRGREEAIEARLEEEERIEGGAWETCGFTGKQVTGDCPTHGTLPPPKHLETDSLDAEFAKVNAQIVDGNPEDAIERMSLISRRNVIASELRARAKPPDLPGLDAVLPGFSKVEKEAVAHVQAFLSKMKKGESGLGEGILELQKKLEDFQGVPVPKPCTCGHDLAGHEVGNRKNPIPGRCLHESCGCSAYVPGKVEE